MTQINKDQLPQGAQKATGNTKNAVGVIEEGFVPDGDVLANQASAIMRNAPVGSAIYGGGSSNFSEETIQAVIAGQQQFQRDQAYVGNNANFTGYYLEDGAKYVIPQMTPLRNMTPRDPLPGIDIVNWRAITDYFGGSGPSVATAALQQQSTPSSLSYVWVNQSNVAKMLAVKDVVTFESEIYGKMFQGDVRATVAAKLIPALMQEEEIWLINSGQKLWTPPPVQLSAATTGGSLSAATYWFIVTAANANGETLGTTIQSVVVGGSGSGSITVTIFTVPSATKYNVYVGTGGTAPANSAMWLQSASSNFGGASALNQPSGVAKGYFTATLTSTTTSGTAYSSVVSAGNTAITVKSTDSNTLNQPLTFDGALALIYTNTGTNSTLGVTGETPYVQQPVAANGTLALSDIDTLLENMFLSAHADPEYLFVGVKDHKTVSQLVAQGTNFRITAANQGDMATLIAGQRVTKYINQTTGRLMDVVMLPYLTQGTIMAGSFSIPFPVTAIEKPPFRIGYNREMWAIELPPDQGHVTQWMYTAYLNECPVNQYIGGWGCINGITLP